MGFPPSPSAATPVDPSSPVYTAADLSITEASPQDDSFRAERVPRRGAESSDEKNRTDGFVPRVEVAVGVVEQRMSNLAQGAACAVMMTGPFLKLLGWVPKGVLAGLFVSSCLTPRCFSRLSHIAEPNHSLRSGTWARTLSSDRASPTFFSTSLRTATSSRRRNPSDASERRECAPGRCSSC
jgi:hypothetical protein